MKRKRRLRYKNIVKLVTIISILVLLVAVALIFLFSSNNKKNISTRRPASTTTSSSALPGKTTDWNLILVNRDHKTAELNPTLTQLGNIQVDSRIASSAQSFLAAAQQIDPAEHFISGYRSVAYQAQLYEMYIEQEMSGQGTVNQSGQAISRAEAEKNVQTYSQPPGCSEHQTGLAIDMSDVNSLDAAPADVVDKIKAIAPKYGFILRFPKDGTSSTGVGYEDWHWRYVGVPVATYIMKQGITLEQYLKQLGK